MALLAGDASPTTRAELALAVKRLREAQYTQIRSLTVAGAYLLVQLQRVNRSGGEREFILDVYDRKGTLKYYGAATPGILQSSPEGLFFAQSSDSGMGSVTIRECRLKST